MCGRDGASFIRIPSGNISAYVSCWWALLNVATTSISLVFSPYLSLSFSLSL